MKILKCLITNTECEEFIKQNLLEESILFLSELENGQILYYLKNSCNISLDNIFQEISLPIDVNVRKQILVYSPVVKHLQLQMVSLIRSLYSESDELKFSRLLNASTYTDYVVSEKEKIEIKNYLEHVKKCSKWYKEQLVSYKILQDANESLDFNIDNLRYEIIKYIDSTVDSIYSQAVGNRTEEYKAAEAEAIAFKDSNYTSTASRLISDYAEIKGWSDQQACDDILYQANAWRAAIAEIRKARLSLKEATRAATDEQQLNTVKQQAIDVFTVIKQQLGIS